MKNLFFATAFALSAMSGIAKMYNYAACGSVSIAEMNWASAQLMANSKLIILKDGYGCDVSIVPGDTMPTFTSMNEKKGRLM